MRTITVLGAVLMFGLAFALLSGSGVGASVFGQDPGAAETTRTLEELGNESSVDADSAPGSLSADVAGENEPTTIGVAISVGQFLASWVGAVALLPVALIRLGFPAYFAVPVGSIAQVVAFVGLAQFIRTGELI